MKPLEIFQVVATTMSRSHSKPRSKAIKIPERSSRAAIAGSCGYIYLSSARMPLQPQWAMGSRLAVPLEVCIPQREDRHKGRRSPSKATGIDPIQH
jgi:hypothetical protein